MKTTYFGLEIIDHYYVLEEDIQKLPFYEFWQESSIGSTFTKKDYKTYVSLSDWEAFCEYFIKTGKHRYKN